ncbi:hypothetical protein COJ85_16650 [Bacillus sp. AFS076308]|nr:hypothetical protein COJ85_16650 [Bacillus sp. AFS076308]PGV48695.1 hypothetical protein COD92_25225 [Bacillus sp. AFS037270]
MTKYEKEAGVKIVWGDLTDYHDVLKCVEGADYVLHVGGLVSPAADYLPSMTTNDIKIRKDERLLAAKSIMGVMCLAIRKGEEITLIADGIDECKAIKSIETFLTKENL